MNRCTRYLLLISLAAAATLVGFGLLQHRHTESPTTTACAQGAPAYWYDPMEPQQRFDKPGKSPFMDMQLVAKCGDGASAGGITIDARVVQNLGLRVAPVQRENVSRVIDTVGVVAVDEHRIEAIEVRQLGWVEELSVRAVGDPVRRGQRLAGVYAPELFATQVELLIAATTDDPRLVEAARQRLMLLGLSAAQVSQVEKTGKAQRRVAYFAPFDGYVMAMGARHGASVAPGTMLFQLASLEGLWVTAEVPEIQVGWINTGDPVTVDVPALPGEHFEGRIDYLYPELTTATRTMKVRVAVRNPKARLRPGMFAEVQLRGATREAVLTVPTEAVIKTGTRTIVIVVTDERHFRPVLVRVGAEQNGRSEILDGLSVGQNIVASGQFLIDSEASLRGAFEYLAGSSAAEAAGDGSRPTPVPSSHAPAEAH